MRSPREWLGSWLGSRRMRHILASLGSAGDRCYVYSTGTFLQPQNISIGDDVLIGPDAWFSAVEAPIVIADKVTIGPRVAVITGDHNTGKLGVFVHDVTEKRPEDDLPVVIEDDVWIGYGVTVLKGVTIGRGSVVGACAVVVKSVPPYSVVVGNPAQVVRQLWDADSAMRHEEALYGRVISDLSRLHGAPMGDGAGESG